MTSRSNQKEKDQLLKTNKKLSLKLENFEERISLEGGKLNLLKEENRLLKDSLASVRQEKEALVIMVNKNYGLLSKSWSFVIFRNNGQEYKNIKEHTVKWT